jgi:hypothetical protein
MSAELEVRAEVKVFRDIAEKDLAAFDSLHSSARTSLEEVDVMLQESENPLPVLNINVYQHRGLRFPTIWMGLGLTEPNKGLQYVEDSEYIPYPDKPSTEIKVPGLAIPVSHDSMSSVNFFPFSLPGEARESTWWEHWQRHRFTQQSAEQVHTRDFEDEIGLPPIATWTMNRRARHLALPDAVVITRPSIIFGEPDASEVSLTPSGEQGLYFEDRERAAIFVGEYATQCIIDDSSRIGVPKQLAPESFHFMMTAVANELGLTYRSE